MFAGRALILLRSCQQNLLQLTMSQRNSPTSIKSLTDLNQLTEIVVDKRYGQRASSKKNRRNRHYEKQFIRNTLSHGLLPDPLDEDGLAEPVTGRGPVA